VRIGRVDRPLNVRGPLIVAVLCTLLVLFGPPMWTLIAMVLGLIAWVLVLYRWMVMRRQRQRAGEQAVVDNRTTGPSS
jgi:uncharacterized membrane protein